MTAWVTPPSKPPKSGIESSETNGRLLVDEQEIVVYNDSQIVQDIANQASQLTEKAKQHWIDVTDKKYGADSTGFSDSSEAFRKAVNALPASGGVIYAPKGTYIVNYLETGIKNVAIIGDGIGITTIKRNQNVRIIQSVGDGTNTLEIKNLTIDGAQYRTIGVRAGTLKRLSIVDAEIKNCGLFTLTDGSERGSVDAVFCVNVEYGFFTRSIFNDNERDGILGYPVVHMTVRDCVFERNGRFPAANQQDDQLINYPLTAKFINNYAYKCGAGGFDAETHSSFPPVYGQYHGNTIIDCGDFDVGYSWGIIMGINSFGEITDNYIKGLGKNSTNSQYRSGIACSGNKGTILINGNRVIDSGRHGIFVESAGNEVIVTNNVVMDNAEQGMFIYNSPKCIIENNIVKNNKEHGIKLNLASNALINGNQIVNNSQKTLNTYSAIKTELSYNVSVTNNKMDGSSHKHGLEIDDPQYISSLNYDNNQVLNVGTSWFNLVGNIQSGSFINGKARLFNQFYNAPTSGTWRSGDIVYHSAPVANQYMGFVCVAGGSPGTWKGFGMIQA